jgi:uncharacterized delta-60 repeat protein
MSIRFSVISNSATYQLNRSVIAVDENAQVTITLTTTGVQNGQALPYTISGTGITTSDFVGLSSLTGEFTVIDGSANVVLTTNGDLTVEGKETFTLALDNGTSITVDINDTSALPPETYWINTIGSSNGADEGLGVAVDSNGNVITVGYARAPATDTQDIFVVKYNKDGAIQWQRAIGTIVSTTEAAYGVATDSAGNIYVIGNVNDGSGYLEDVVLIKLNASGTSQWQRVMRGFNGDRGYGVAVDASNNVYVCGYGDDITTAQYAKYDSTGTIVWKYKLSTTYAAFYSMTVDSSGNLYMVGRHSAEAVVVKTDTNGNVQWQTVIGNQDIGLDFCQGVGVDAAGNVYVSGYQNRTTSGTWDAFVLKLNGSGVVQWQRRIGGAGDDRGTDLAVSSAGDAYMVARAVSGATGAADIVIVKYDTTGALQWQRRLAGAAGDYGYGIALGAQDSVIVAATQNSQTQGSFDILTAKLPGDGSKTGTYGNFTYSASSLTEGAASLPTTAGTMTKSASTLTSSAISLTVSTPTFTNTFTQIP